MSSFLNLGARRIAADVYGGNESKLNAAISAVGYTGQAASYVNLRARLWFAKWAAAEVKDPSSLPEDPDEDLSAHEPLTITEEVEPEPEPEPEYKDLL